MTASNRAVALGADLLVLATAGFEWVPNRAAGLREGLGTLAAMAFAAVVTALLVREQRARAELSAAHERLRAPGRPLPSH